MPLIGYARVYIEDQTPLPQSEALRSAGCGETFEEHASGGNRARPVLARALERVQSGDTLVVVRMDRLARSLSHLLEVIERLEARGAFFRSIQDPIDTASPQGKFTLQVLGAARPPPAAGYDLGRCAADYQWPPAPRPPLYAKPLTPRREGYVRDGFLPDEVLGRAGRRKTDDRLPAIVAAIKGADPDITLQAICDRLESMRERTPRGRMSWQPSSVRMLLERAERLGLQVRQMD